MSIYRIATANSFDNALLNINKRLSDVSTSQDQLSSGKRVLKASDDAVSATLAERARNREARATSDLRALEASRTALTQAESALGEATDITHRVRELLVQAGDPVLSANSRNDLALQLEGLREQMLSVANRKDTSGLTLFGGLGGAAKPFVDLYGPDAGVKFMGQRGQYAPTESTLPQAIDGNAAWMNTVQANGVFVNSLNQANTGDVNVAAPGPTVATAANLPTPADNFRVEFLNDPANNDLLSFQVVNQTTGAIEVPLTVYNPSPTQTVSIAGPGTGATPPGTFDLSFDLQGTAQAGDVVQINAVNDTTTGLFDHYTAVADTGNAGQLHSTLGTFTGNPYTAVDSYRVEFATDPLTSNMMAQVVNTSTGSVVLAPQVYDPLGTTLQLVGPNFQQPITLSGPVVDGDTIDITPNVGASGEFVDFQATPSLANTGTPVAALGNVQGDPSALHQYEVEFVTNTTFRVRDTTVGGFVPLDNATPVPPTTDTYTFENNKTISFNGISLELQGVPKTGDRLSINPTGSQPTDIFQTLQNAIDALRYNGSNQGAHLTQEIGRSLQEIDSGLDTLSVARGRVGDWLNRADNMDGLFNDRVVFHQKEASDLTDLDMVKGISEFQTNQTAMDAALKAYAQVQKLSLFQYIS